MRGPLLPSPWAEQNTVARRRPGLTGLRPRPVGPADAWQSKNWGVRRATGERDPEASAAMPLPSTPSLRGRLLIVGAVAAREEAPLRSEVRRRIRVRVGGRAERTYRLPSAVLVAQRRGPVGPRLSLPESTSRRCDVAALPQSSRSTPGSRLRIERTGCSVTRRGPPRRSDREGPRERDGHRAVASHPKRHHRPRTSAAA
jgi:hypothetical protein